MIIRVSKEAGQNLINAARMESSNIKSSKGYETTVSSNKMSPLKGAVYFFYSVLIVLTVISLIWIIVALIQKYRFSKIKKELKVS